MAAEESEKRKVWQAWLKLIVCIQLLFAVAQIAVAAILLFRANSWFESVVIALLLLILVQNGGRDQHEEETKRRLVRIHAAIVGREALSGTERSEYQDAEKDEQRRQTDVKLYMAIEFLRLSAQVIVGLIAVAILIKSALGL